MEKLFQNLYRTGTTENKRGHSHSYFLTRKEGNLLICHQQGPSSADIKEIEKLGGIESMWISHSHDTLRNLQHDALHKRFGCSLYLHKLARPAARKRAKCQFETFGDEGLEYAPDFEALYYPACTAGHAVYRWRNRGKYFLFSAHALYANEGKWDLHFRARKTVKLHQVHVDYVVPGYTAVDGPAFYRLDDQLRKSLSREIRAIVKKAA